MKIEKKLFLTLFTPNKTCLHHRRRDPFENFRIINKNGGIRYGDSNALNSAEIL
jgi:hypothetical protein